MSYLSRLAPETLETRLEALLLAKNKMDSLPPGTNPLTAATTARLIGMTGDYSTKFNSILTAAFAYNGNTPVKESAQYSCALHTNHFIQVFNLGIKRGVYTAAQRDFFNLPVGSDALPDLDKAVDVLKWANAVVNGDANRITAGGAAMSNPTAAEVQATLTPFHTAFDNQSNFKDALDAAEETLEAILAEADKVIKKVWDELETFYNEESDESRRDNCREWGVVYVLIGSDKVMSGTVTYNGSPVEGFTVKFTKGKNKSTTTAAGAYSLNTRMMGIQKVDVIKLDENNKEVKKWQFEVELTENDNLIQNFVVND